jgi:hypothetical protein
LEVHANDRRRSWVTEAIMAVTIDPVKDGLNLVFVVLMKNFSRSFPDGQYLILSRRRVMTHA